MNTILILLFLAILLSSVFYLFKGDIKKYFIVKPQTLKDNPPQEAEEDVFEMPSDEDIKKLEQSAITILKYRGLSASDEGDALIAMRELGSKNFSPVTYVKMINKMIEQNKK